MSEREEAAGLQVGGLLAFMPDGRGHSHSLNVLVLNCRHNGGQYRLVF